jgi:hypothetical protein
MSNSERSSRSASGQMLDDGVMSGKNEMGAGTRLVSSNSNPRDLLRRYLRADLDTDRMLTPVTGGKIDPQIGSVFQRPISPVQDFRFHGLTVDESGPPPETPNRNTITINDGEHRFSVGRDSENFPNTWVETGDQMGQNPPGEDQLNDFGSGHNVSSGEFRYRPTLTDKHLLYVRQSAIDVYNQTPQASLGGKSPQELVYQRETFPSQLPEGPGTVPERFHQGRESLSVIQNITIRESKRPKAAHDQSYRRRSLVSPSLRASIDKSIQPQHFGMDSHPQIERVDGGAYQRNGGSTRDPDPGGFSSSTPVSRRDNGGNSSRSPRSSTGIRGPPQEDGNYEINLIFEGRVVRHGVSADMLVSRLKEDAGLIYHLDARNLILVLFGLNPHTLESRGRLSDPPQVMPGATIMIFNTAVIAMHPGRAFPIAPASVMTPVAAAYQGPSVGSKLLANFKLVKFDGTSRSWKQWDKSFIRFLSIHQLD